MAAMPETPLASARRIGKANGLSRQTIIDIETIYII
jgi:hypothetical protein